MIEQDPPQKPDGRRPVRSRRELESEFRTHIWSPNSPSQVEEEMLLTIGRYVDGQIAEVFVDYPVVEGLRRKGERTINLGHDIATLISIALQYGAPLKVLRDSMGRGEVNLMGTTRTMSHTIIGTILDHLVEREGGK